MSKDKNEGKSFYEVEKNKGVDPNKKKPRRTFLGAIPIGGTKLTLKEKK